MRTNFHVAKEMARALMTRFGVAYVNYSKESGYFSTTCMTPYTIGKIKDDKFSIIR